ncbi:MFS transporter [Streptomyces sp. INA 01156]
MAGSLVWRRARRTSRTHGTRHDRTTAPCRTSRPRLRTARGGREDDPVARDGDRARRAGAWRGRDGDPAGRAARRAQVEPHENLVLHSGPCRQPTWWAIRYVLRVRTDLILIVASALGYFYFVGLRSFATIYTTGRYGVTTSVATSLVLVVGIGMLAGSCAGRTADRLLRRGRVNARVLVPTVCMLTVPLLFAPAIHATSLALALPLLVAGTLFLGAANPHWTPPGSTSSRPTCGAPARAYGRCCAPCAKPPTPPCSATSRRTSSATRVATAAPDSNTRCSSSSSP